MNRFGMLLRYYRRRSSDPDRGGMLTQEQLGELLGNEPGTTRYSGAAISDWERSKSEINHNYRSALVGLIKVLHDCGGISSISEANEFLLSGNYRPLSEEELLPIFPDTSTERTVPADASVQGSLQACLGNFYGFLTELRKKIFRISINRDDWSEILLKGIRIVSEKWSLEKFFSYMAWVGVWLITLRLTFPILQWPLANPGKASEATRDYVIGALLVPLMVGALINTRAQDFWQRQGLATSRVLRLFAYTASFLAFHVGYMMVVAIHLLGYHLGFNSVLQWLSPVAALWPVVLSAAAARQLPVDQLRAYGALQFKNGAVFLLFVLFGPMWAAFFYRYSSIILSPVSGFIVLFAALASLTALERWQKRRQIAFIPAQLWAAGFGVLFLLYLVSQGSSTYGVAAYSAVLGTLIVFFAKNQLRVTFQGGLGFFIVVSLLLLAFSINREAGRIITVLAMLVWILRGRKYLWAPISIWLVIIPVVVFGLLIRDTGLDQTIASIALTITTLVILYFYSHALRHNSSFS